MRSNQRNLIIIVGILVVGGSLELMRTVSSEQSDRTRQAEVALARLETRPYSRSKAGSEAQSADQNWEMKKAERLKQLRPSGTRHNNGITLKQLKEQAQADSEQKHSFTHGETKTEKNKDKKEGKDKKKDKKDKDKDKDKKDKKEKDDEDSKKDPSEEQSDSEERDQEDNDQEESDDSGNTQTAGTDAPVSGATGELPPKPEEDENTLSFEAWARLLLNQPNHEETIRLIRLHQSQQVSNEVFYLLVEAMLEDSRMPMKELGVLAAGRSPGYRSFLLLSRVIQRESYNSPLSAQAKKELQLYSQLSSLPTLKQVMQQSDEVFAVMLAAEKLDQSAKQYLSQDEESPDPESQGDNSDLRPHKNANYFQGFISVLEYRSTNSSDSEMARVLSQALETLQQLLAS